MRIPPRLQYAPAVLLGLLVSLAAPAARSIYTSGSAYLSTHGAGSTSVAQREWLQDFSSLHGKTITAVDLIRYRHRTRKWIAGDIGALIDQLSSSGVSGLFDSDTLKSSIREAALADPRGTLEAILTKLSPANGRDAALLSAFEIVGKNNPGEAIAFLDRLPDYLRRTFENELGSNLGNEKGMQALAAAKSKLPPDEWGVLFNDAAFTWAGSDPVGAVKAIAALATPGAVDIENMLEMIAGRIPPKDFALASQSLPQLSRYAAENAATQVERENAAYNTYSAILSAGRGSSRIDSLNAAVRQAEALPEGPHRIQTLENLALVATNIDRSQVIALAQQIPSYAQRTRAYEQAVQFNPDGTRSASNADWAQTIPDPLSRYAVESNIVETWINTNPAAFADYALAGDQGSDFANILVQKVPAFSAPEGTVALPDWLSNLPAGKLQALRALAQKPAPATQ